MAINILYSNFILPGGYAEFDKGIRREMQVDDMIEMNTDGLITHHINSDGCFERMAQRRPSTPSQYWSLQGTGSFYKCSIGQAAICILQTV